MGTSPALGWIKKGWTDRPLRLDLVFYGVCAAYALALALTDKSSAFRVWASFAVAGYGLALAHATWLRFTPRTGDSGLRSRWVGVGCVGVVGMILPLLTLVVRRPGGGDWAASPGSWSAQPEVWVIERSASLLLRTGTPYVDVTALGRTPVVDDYTPYGPVMPLFGLPRALFGDSAVTDALTDARVYFVLIAALCAWGTLRLLGRPRIPVRAAQLAVAFPLTALTFAVAGPDLAIVGLLVLAYALAAIDRPGWAALVLALVTSAKLIVAPALVVLGALVLARRGARALGRFAAVFVTVTALVNVPVLLVDPAAFVEHVVRFPAGLGEVSSPAASPLPGHLIASTGSAGTAVTFALLAAAAIAILGWLLRRPPTTGADALLRLAVGLGAFTLLTPATRFGYLVYPCVLLGAMLCFRAADQVDRTGAATSS